MGGERESLLSQRFRRASRVVVLRLLAPGETLPAHETTNL
jgi:hypothetical protein